MSDNSIMNIGDLAEPVKVLIEKIGDATGILYEPKHIVAVAEAQAKAAKIQAESEIETAKIKAEVAKIQAEAQIEITDLQRRAAQRWIAEQGQQQESIENTIIKAIPQLNEDADPKAIEDDWIIKFFDKCRLVTDDEVQDLWASILAGEANSAGAYSPKALTILADMNQNSLMLFNAFCSLCLVNLDNPRLLMASPPIFKIKDARVPIIKGDFKEAYVTSLPISDEELRVLAQKSESIYKGYGFGLKDFQLLLEHGLIEGSSLMEYNLFWYNNELWGILEPSSYFPSTLEDYKEITITGYALTSVGRELFHITKHSSPLGYFEKITEFLKIYYDANIVKLSKR
ncbi:DUF2806 domain-containing protein [Candidatus Poribacteria bacterium]|nr:DUF2806 domain-containing protein [Candidatus Poribacteria bacterium]